MSESQPQNGTGQRVERPPAREDLYSGRRIAWRWVFAGTLIVLGAETLVWTSIRAFGGDPGAPGAFFAVSTAAYFVGGIVIGWLSPGWTVWEAGYACVLAGLWGAVLTWKLQEFGSAFPWVVPPGLAWGILCGLAGGRLGEKIQGRA